MDNSEQPVQNKQSPSDNYARALFQIAIDEYDVITELAQGIDKSLCQYMIENDMVTNNITENFDTLIKLLHEQIQNLNKDEKRGLCAHLKAKAMLEIGLKKGVLFDLDCLFSVSGPDDGQSFSLRENPEARRGIEHTWKLKIEKAAKEVKRLAKSKRRSIEHLKELRRARAAKSRLEKAKATQDKLDAMLLKREGLSKELRGESFCEMIGRQISVG